MSEFTVRGPRTRLADDRYIRVRWDGMHHVVEVVVSQSGGDYVVAREVGHFASSRHAVTYAKNESERTGYNLMEG